MVLGKAFIHCFDELPTDVGGDVGAIRWVEPNDVSFSRAFWFWRLVVQFKVVFISTFFQGFLIWGNSVVKRLSEEMLDSLLLMAFGMLRSIDGGWLP